MEELGEIRKGRNGGQLTTYERKRKEKWKEKEGKGEIQRESERKRI